MFKVKKTVTYKNNKNMRHAFNFEVPYLPVLDNFIKTNTSFQNWNTLNDSRSYLLTFTLYNKPTSMFPINSNILTGSKSWELKFWLLLVTYQNLEFVGRFRHKIVKSLFSVIFFENTLSLKQLFFFWVKLMPLRIHKRLLVTLSESMLFVQFFNNLFSVKFKLLLYVKGKLGLQGDSKKKKSIYSFGPDFKYKIGTGLSYDGVGSASRFGLTFFKVVYAQTDFTELKFYDYIPE